MASTTEAHWYAIRTGARCEKVVRDNLTTRQIESRLPLARRVSHWKQKHKVIEWPLFPGYCFARFSIKEIDAVLRTPGVVNIASNGHGPVPLPDNDLTTVMRVSELSARCQAWPFWQEGTPVIVVRGPLKGLRGQRISAITATRVVLSLDLIQQAIAILVEADDLMPVEHGRIHA